MLPQCLALTFFVTALFGPAAEAAMITGQWDFNRGDLRSTVGKELLYRDSTTASATSFEQAVINGQTAQVMHFPATAPAQGYIMPHNGSANGGGKLVNQYTIIFDLMFSASESGKWRSLLQTDEANASDGDLFISPTDGIGISGVYDGLLQGNTWHRVAFVVDNTQPSLRKFIDGNLVGTQTLLSGVDGRFALEPTALLFTDEDNETASGYVNSIQFRNGLTSDDEIAALGGPTAAGIPREAPLLTCPPDITVGCQEGTDLAITGEATATSLCINPGTLTISHSDTVEDFFDVLIIHREWQATDDCGTSTCVQTITEDRSQPVVNISEASYFNGAIKQYTVTANQPFFSVDWQVEFSTVFDGEPGVRFNGSDQLTINYLEFRGGNYLSDNFIEVSVNIATACNGGFGSITSGAGGLPLYTLSRGASPFPASGTGSFDPGFIDSACGPQSAGSPAFAFEASQSGFMRFTLESADSLLFVIADPTVFPLSVAQCVQTDLSGKPAVINQPVNAGDILYVVASASTGTVGFSGALVDSSPFLTIPDDITVRCDQIDDLDITGRATAESLCNDPGLSVSFTDTLLDFGDIEVQRHWTATDSCGTTTKTQVIIGHREPLNISIAPLSILGTAIQQFLVSANQPFNRVSFEDDDGTILPGPGVTFQGNDSLIVNFSIYKNGRYLNSNFNLQVLVSTDCTGGGQGGSFPIGSIPLYTLTRGAPPFSTNAVGSAEGSFLDGGACGTLDAGSPPFSFRGDVDGTMRLSLNTPNARLFVLRDLNTFPFPVSACAVTAGESAFVDVPVKSGEIIYAAAGANAGGAVAVNAFLLTDLPPTISGLADQTIRVGSSAEVFFTLSDDKTPAKDLNIQVTSLSPNLLPEAGVRLLNSDGSVRMTIGPAAGLTGVGGLQIRVTDADGLSTSQTVQITVQSLLTPALTWEIPADIVYGTPLGHGQLNALADPPVGVFSYTPAMGAILDAGSHILSVSYTPSDQNYSSAMKSVTIHVTQALPELTWPAPASLVIGTPLSDRELNATASPSGGTFTYSPPKGAILPAGSQTLTVTYEPNNPNYRTASQSVSIEVTQPHSEIHWGKPNDIPFGTPLGGEQLNATGSPQPGTFLYDPPSGTLLPLGEHTLSATYTPSDSAFLPVSATVTLKVVPASAVITWADPADIVFGTPLTSKQLNATAEPAGGTLRYDPDFGTVLPVGTNTLRVTYTPNTANYVRTVKTVTIVVTRFPSVVIWPTPADIEYGTPLSEVQLNAVGSPPGGTYAYSPGPGVILPAGDQTLTVTYSPTDPNYLPTTRSVTIHVQGLSTTVSWNNPNPVVYGTALSSQQLNATAVPAGGVFAYDPAPGTVLPAGNHTLSVVYTPADPGTQPASKSVNLIVVKALLKVKGQDVAKTYGASDPPFTVTFSPFVNGDTAASIGGAPGFIRDAGENVGTYGFQPIQGTLRADNYSFGEFQSGSLTILKAPLSARADDFSRQVGEPNPVFTGRVTGIVKNEPITASYTTEATPASPPGRYTITPKLAPDTLLKNYEITLVPGTLAITGPVLSAVRRSGNGIQFSLDAPNGQVFRIESTPSIPASSWQAEGTITIQNGTAPFDWTFLAGDRRRYFRAVRISP